MRLVFVADRTPKEHRRLVEFLNAEMTNVELLAVEVKQFQGKDVQGQRALARTPADLAEEEIEALLAVFERHCGAGE